MSDDVQEPVKPKPTAGGIGGRLQRLGGLLLLVLVSFFLGRFSSNWPLDSGTSEKMLQLGTPSATGAAKNNPFDLPDELLPFFDLVSPNPQVNAAAFEKIKGSWKDSYVVMLLEVLHFTTNPEILRGAVDVIESSVENDLGPFDMIKWLQWVWSTDPGLHPHYAKFKSVLYRQLDASLGEYFKDAPQATIRLDEVLWGGVRRDGIPPLDHPEMISVGEATYLRDDNVVFSVEINGDARAYPKRILAHHEMVKDKVGDLEINGVYCTLCGSMIVYDASVDGVHYELGTSGFLYRSNKLMYDHTTLSLWNTLTGKPVVGPLVGNGIELQAIYTVTSTWGEWRRRHPDTKVLSLNTGHQRDYGEGVAYQEYFATDKLMFPVPRLDNRLQNKAEILVLRFAEDDVPLAISAEFLDENRLYTGELAGVRFVVLTDKSGANRVYETQDNKFVDWDHQDSVVDGDGNSWRLAEDGLRLGEQLLKRLPAHRAFWFGWYSVHPETRLIQLESEQ